MNPSYRFFLMWCGLGLVVWPLASCTSGRAPSAAPSPPAAYSEVGGSDSRAEGGLRVGDSVVSRHAVDGLLAAEEAPAARPRKSRSARPGLATQAGSDTWSEVNDSTFYRKAGGHPDAIDSFHYNDATGAKAMAEALGEVRKKGGTFSAAGGRLEVSLLSGSWGGPYDRYEAGGRRIVIGEAGHAYQIVLRNKTQQALEVVASVDGLDVIDGKPAAIQKRGYIMPARSSLSIEGFRKDRRTVKRFVFGSVDGSLAAQSGKSRHVGVIGLAVYDEDEVQARAARLAEARQRQGASAFPGGGDRRPSVD